jgi:hypothetical protein
VTKVKSTPNKTVVKPMPARKALAASAPAPKAPAAKAAAKKVDAAPAAVAKAQPAPSVAKAAKAPKLRQKPVRDSFTMPEVDFALIAALKARLLAARRETKKSELLRAGLHVLAGLDTPALAAALGKLDPVKVGRPKKGH